MNKVSKDIIYETTDYDLFALHSTNRKVKEQTRKFKNLVKSMKTYGFLPSNPLHCTKVGNKLFIKSGHHRLRAAIMTDIPVKYVISDSPIKIYELENAGAGKWVMSDYLESFAKKGIPDYVALKEYCDNTGMAPSVAVALFNGNPKSVGSGNEIRDVFGVGSWKISNTEFPEIVGNIVIQLKNKGHKWASHRSFVSALSRVILIDSFDIDSFRYKLKTKPDLLEKQRSIDKYLEMIEIVYNHGTPKNKKLPIKHLAETLT